MDTHERRQIAETAWVLLDRTPEEQQQVFVTAYENAIAAHPDITREQAERVTQAMVAYVAAVYAKMQQMVRDRGSA